MILGIFQRHYKIYKGISFMPFHCKEPENLTVVIGNNGCGKSSLLEAVDTFFNNREFNINLGSKKSQAFVAPLFLIDETNFKTFTPTHQKYLKIISDFLWDETYSEGNYKPIKNFFEFRDSEISNYRNTHYLITTSKEFDSSNSFFLTFTASIQKSFKDNGLKILSNSDFNKITNHIKSIYTYLYIPIETSIQEFLKIETVGMQNLIDKKISSEIDNTLTKKQIRMSTGRKGGKQVSLLDLINITLKKYIDETEKTIKNIYDGYDFKMDYRARQNLTSNDIKDQIIYSYLSKRTLKKDDKPIKSLSAGERKKALIDIAYSFISGAKNRDSQIILAIDEPESSLHISNCYDQFTRIEEISDSQNCQVLLTTHWYGSLPIINKGTLIQIDLDETNIPIQSRFKFKNYFEDRGNHPNDIQLKSFYDLTSSIISSLKHYSTNWLIVEGLDDYNYLYSNLNVKNLKVIPVGGCGVVKLLYDFLYVPLSHKSEVLNTNGKILCLTDTDLTGPKLQHESNTKSNKLRFRRLQIIGNTIKLVKNEHQARIPLEVEECINPNDFYNCLLNVSLKYGDDVEQSLFDDIEPNENATDSRIKGDQNMLKFSGLADDLMNLKQDIVNFIEKYKDEISLEYTNLETKVKMPWMEEIENFFKE